MDASKLSAVLKALDTADFVKLAMLLRDPCCVCTDGCVSRFCSCRATQPTERCNSGCRCGGIVKGDKACDRSIRIKKPKTVVATLDSKGVATPNLQHFATRTPNLQFSGAATPATPPLSAQHTTSPADAINKLKNKKRADLPNYVCPLHYSDPTRACDCLTKPPSKPVVLDVVELGF